MKPASSKDHFTILNHPRALSSIIISVGILAVFITLASWILVSYPIGTVVRSYFYGVGTARDTNLPITLEGVGEIHNDSKLDKGDTNKPPRSEVLTELAQKQNVNANQEQDLSVSSGNDAMPSNSNSGEQAMEGSVSSQNKDSSDSEATGSSKSKSLVDSECDLYHGEWFFDSAGPLYTNSTCPVLTQMQNC